MRNRGYGPAEDPRLRAGLAAHWVGIGSNRSWDDKSGNGRHAVAPGAPSDARRVLDRSVDFRGIECLDHPGNVFASYDAAHHSSMDISAAGFTVAAWLYVRGSASIQMAMSKYPGWYIYADGSLERASFTYGGADHMTANGTFPRLRWMHFAATCDATNYEMFFNGVSAKVGTTTASGTGSPVSIGNYALTYPWNGLISDVRIYSRSLSTAEIALLADPSPSGSLRRSSIVSVGGGGGGGATPVLSMMTRGGGVIGVP
jgi:hypothetical protein